MIEDMQIVKAAKHAERIKKAMPELPVSTDAIFSALLLGKRAPGRPSARHLKSFPLFPPPWFEESLQILKGQSLTINRFLLLSGRFPYNREEARAVGRWLRASMRLPRKHSGQQLFDI